MGSLADLSHQIIIPPRRPTLIWPGTFHDGFKLNYDSHRHTALGCLKDIKLRQHCPKPANVPGFQVLRWPVTE